MISHAVIYIMVQSSNSSAVLFSNHESGHDLKTEEKSGLKYFWLNTTPAQVKEFQIFFSQFPWMEWLPQ